VLKKFIAIKNVGRFRNSAGTPNPQLKRQTFIAGANGFGKTTICAILRSLASGEPAHVVGRKTLGSTDPLSVELLFDSGLARFDNGQWSTIQPNIAIFDGIFVAQNVHAGDVVDVDQRRNLYRVIIGSDGVALADEEARLAAESRTKTGEITSAGRAVSEHALPGMTIADFVALPADPDIDLHIVEQEAVVRSCTEATAVGARSALAVVPFPAVPAAFSEVLATTLDDIGADAEKLISEHLAAHGMAAEDYGWVAAGVDHTGDSCPFCGQDVKGLDLIAAYRSIFSEQYKAFGRTIQEMRDTVQGLLGDAAIGRMNTLAEQNAAAAEFWRQHVAVDPGDLSFTEASRDAARAIGIEALALLDHKILAPLEKMALSDSYSSAKVLFDDAIARSDELNLAIQAANGLIEEKKREVAQTDLQSAKNQLARLKAIRARHTEPASGHCDLYTRLVQEKADAETAKDAARGQLNTHTLTTMPAYERRINELLDLFNAGFTIAKTKHSYPAGIATSHYQLVINNEGVDLGDAKSADDVPSFKNTLSSGDRTTLALAFFLASVERQAQLGDVIVVFDDPFNSQDSFRRRQTVHEIARIAKESGQTIVLSHDATFLKQVWDKAPLDAKIAFTIVDQRSLGAKIQEFDLDAATKGRTATDTDDLQTFVSTGAGGLLDIVRKMRVVLETYCRTMYPADFTASDWLGDIVSKIRAGGTTHPAAALYDELDQINDYTKQYHHGEDTSDATPDNVDVTELTGFTRRTLRLVNALQA